jgi:anaerobic ribonucleoside-triphosphate reductase activating protein
LISINFISEYSRSEGPGERFVIWVQGCSIRCPGCCNPEMLPFESGEQIDVQSLFERIIKARVEGITLLGGEPFDQAEECGALAEKVQGNGMGVMVFSGYTMDFLAKSKKCDRLLKHTDLLKAGPYMQEQHSRKHRWIGSSNQQLIFLTDRYRNHPDIREDNFQSVTIDLTDGQCTASGWPEFFQ